MINACKSELRKIYTIRSTYVIFLLAVLFTGMFALYSGGYKASVASLADPNYIASRITLGANVIGIVIAFIAVLSVTHEYRYNTMLYALTNTKGRMRVLAAKVAAVSGVSLLIGAFFAVLTIAFVYIGAQLGDNAMSAQHIDLAIFGRSLFAVWAFSMYALIISFILRSQVGAIATFLLFPTFVEQFLAFLLKDNQIYLPFAAAGSVLMQNKDISYGTAALVSGAYIVVGLFVSALLFVKRDVN